MRKTRPAPRRASPPSVPSSTTSTKPTQAGRRIIGQATKGRLKVYASRCEKILKTLFLYYIAKMQPNGLSVEEIMNSVMEWADHDKGQKADIKDNLDHYEVLLDELAKELPQVKKVGKNFVFTPEGGGVDVKELFQKARSHAENSEVQQRDAWNQLLGLDGWEIKTSLLTMDLARNTKSIFRGIAPAEQKDFEVEWHGRTIKGRVYMRDLLDIASKGQALPPINTAGHRPRFRRLHQQPALRRQSDRACQEGRRPPHAVLDARPTDLAGDGIGCSTSPPTGNW